MGQRQQLSPQARGPSAPAPRRVTQVEPSPANTEHMPFESLSQFEMACGRETSVSTVRLRGAVNRRRGQWQRGGQRRVGASMDAMT